MNHNYDLHTLDTNEHAHNNTHIKHKHTQYISLTTLYTLYYVCFYAPHLNIRAVFFDFFAYFILFCFFVFLFLYLSLRSLRAPAVFQYNLSIFLLHFEKLARRDANCTFHGLAAEAERVDAVGNVGKRCVYAMARA